MLDARFELDRCGSPPQVRGKPFAGIKSFLSSRITPAGAGKTSRSVQKSAQCLDHPRRCGENIKGVVENATTQGSPPQVRGKLVDIVVWVVGLRITPAGAGKTIKLFVSFSAGGDHPRRCGENGAHARRWCCEMGSPPQVRGKPHYMGLISVLSRITPAGAGKTETYHHGQQHIQDHPRRCGENFAEDCLSVHS